MPNHDLYFLWFLGSCGTFLVCPWPYLKRSNANLSFTWYLKSSEILLWLYVCTMTVLGFFSSALTFVIKNSCSVPQSVLGLGLAERIEFLQLLLPFIESIWFLYWLSGDGHTYNCLTAWNIHLQGTNCCLHRSLWVTLMLHVMFQAQILQHCFVSSCCIPVTYDYQFSTSYFGILCNSFPFLLHQLL